MNNEALVTLDQFGFLAVDGRDATKFLQGYTTCDLEQLSESHVMRGAICNIKGRMVSNFLVCRTPSGLLLRLNKALVSQTEAFLAKYIVFSKAELNQTDALRCYGATGDALTAANANIPTEVYDLAHTEDGILLKVDEDLYEVWTEETIEAEGSLENWQHRELNQGIVWVTSATTEEFIPQMFNLHNQAGISFDKGCYLGQEIVARMQYRGELKNRLHLAQIESPEPIAVGARITSLDGKKLGSVVASSGNTLGMVLKAEETAYCLEDGRRLDVEEVTPAENA